MIAVLHLPGWLYALTAVAAVFALILMVRIAAPARGAHREGAPVYLGRHEHIVPPPPPALRAVPPVGRHTGGYPILTEVAA